MCGRRLGLILAGVVVWTTLNGPEAGPLRATLEHQLAPGGPGSPALLQKLGAVLVLLSIVAHAVYVVVRLRNERR